MTYSYTTWAEGIHGGNTKHESDIIHLTCGSVANTWQALCSGINVTQYSRFSVNIQNLSNASAAAQIQLFGCNNSGTAPAYNGSIWGAIGDSFAVANANASLKSWEITNCRYLMPVGSMSAAISGGLLLDIMLFKYP